MIHSLKNEVNLPELKKANARYADFRNNFDAIDSKIDVWGNELKTGKGERFLTRDLGSTKENRLIGESIKKKTGQSLTGAKIISTVRNLPGAKFFLR